MCGRGGGWEGRGGGDKRVCLCVCVRVLGIDVFVYAHMLLTCLVCVSVLIMLGHSLLILCVCESGGDRRVCLCAHASNLPRVRQCAYYARTLPPYFVCVRVVGIDVYV